MYFCVCVHVCVFVYANANDEIILCGTSCPRCVGTSLSFHRYRTPGTRMDRQADGETVDHKQLRATVLWPADYPGGTHRWLPASSLSMDHALDTHLQEWAAEFLRPVESKIIWATGFVDSWNLSWRAFRMSQESWDRLEDSDRCRSISTQAILHFPIPTSI